MTPSQDSTGSLFIPHHKYNLRNLPTLDLVPILQHSIFLLFLVTLRYALQDYTYKFYPLIHILQNVFHNHIFHLDKTPIHYFLLTYKLHIIQAIIFSEGLIPTPLPPHIGLPQ